ncbi:MAG TPA: CotH kinase family protein [Anaerolineales bacterium]|nr:CotH kinase family protein [Anaerolineales bacterium]
MTNLPKVVNTPLPSVIKQPVAEIDERPFQDNTELYGTDDPGSVVTIYLTVRKGNADDRTNFTWAQLNAPIQWFNENPANNQSQKAEAIVQFGNEHGPLPGEVGYETVVPNATIHVRGVSSSMQPQPSYQIELNQAAGKWRGQSAIVLNKHINDPSRLRNKLNFDLLQGIPNMVSLRTQFVHLYVRDQTTVPEDMSFVDYGLYTQVELPNQRYLKSHLLDSNGQLYKANLFDFERYPDQIRLADDPLFDEQAFSSRLEIKGNRNNSKLIQMLDTLNDPEIPIETTFEKYFDAENYFTWLAYNILVGNVNTVNQNFYLYSPQNGIKFYFIPWDYDDSLFRLSRESCCGYRSYDSYQYGVANYWGSRLANRVLRVPEYRQMLDDKVSEVHALLTPEKIEGLLAQYQPTVEQYALQMPDLQYFPTTKQGMQQDLQSISGEVQNNYRLYLESMQSPMPFHLGTIEASGNGLTFTWDHSYDFLDPQITYHFTLARDPALDEIVSDQTLVNSTSAQVGQLEPGAYFWRVTATNKAGNSQFPFEFLFDSEGVVIPGLKRFYITSDGTLHQ